MRLLAMAVAVLLAGRGADAHTQLVAATPPADAVVAAAPREVVLEFSEPVQALPARWFPAGGGAPIEATPLARGAKLVFPVPAGLGTGTQVLSWRVVSADGHPVGGSLVFSIGARSGTARAFAASGAGLAAAAGRSP
ncbi:MAG TPA: copper resistance CopC family protein, partial [Amaricoccus sp.]|nr:copper resistance CopC family protein [Amaricoccus sp.]